MEAVYFTIAAVVLYVVSNWILEQIEVRIGRRLENRTLVFFFLLLTLALISFAIIRRLTG